MYEKASRSIIYMLNHINYSFFPDRSTEKWINSEWSCQSFGWGICWYIDR